MGGGGRGLKMVVGGAAVPDARKTMREGLKAVVHACEGAGGDDAYFASRTACSQCTALGVADGVHMWRATGVDSGAFSRSLMRECKRLARSLPARSLHAHLNSTLSSALSSSVSHGTVGSCTACLLAVCHNSGSVSSANIGDSGWLLLSRSSRSQLSHNTHSRALADGSDAPSSSSLDDPSYDLSDSSSPLQVRCRSRPLEHLFGWPYQLGTHAAADSTSDADEFEFTLRIGDVLLVGTDGLWDNLHEWEIAEEAENSISRGAAAIARSLASRAYESSLDQDRVTPYSIAASNAFEMVYSGGKRDDIAVVCALAREE